MKKLLLLLFLFQCYFVKSQAPDWAWTKSGGGIYDERPTAISSDKQGNILLAGQFNSPTITFGGVTLSNSPAITWDSTDLFLVKYDSLGNVLWGRTGGGDGNYVNAISTDTSGNVFITGSFVDSISFSGTMLYSTGGGSNTFLTKYDPSGNIVLTRKIDGGWGGCVAQAISTDNNGNIYLSGYFGSDSISFDGIILHNTGSYSIFVVKMDPSGNILWAQGSHGLASGLNMATGVSADSAGNVIITGNFQSNVINFGTDSIVNVSTDIYTDDSYIAKFDAGGNFIWCKGIGGTSMDMSTGIKADRNGNIIVTGYFISPTLTFGGTTFNNPDGSADVFTAKYDPSGNVLWAKQGHGSNEECALGISLDNSDNVYITGYSTSNDLTFGTDTLANYGITIFVTKYNAPGNVSWIRHNRIDNFSEGIAIDGTGHVCITGRLGGAHLYLGTDSLYNNDVTVPYTDDIYISRLSSENNVWPGDANRDMTVNNSDLLPIGLFYGQTGTSRSSTSDSWQPYNSADWGTAEPNGEDIKHSDCNGDGIIDSNDTLAVNLNYSFIHAMIPSNTTIRTSVPDLYFVISGTFAPGQIIDAELWLGNSSMPVTDLYGIAFDISYYAWLVQSGTESLQFPASWLGTPGSNALTMEKTDSPFYRMHGAETRTDHVSANGFGKIADFKFQLNASLSLSDSMVLSVAAYHANDAAGTPLYFNIQPLVLSQPNGIDEQTTGSIPVSVFPNPSASSAAISLLLNESTNVTIEINDQLGRKLTTLVSSKENSGAHSYIFSPADLGCGAGIYFARIVVNGKVIIKKIIIL